MNDFRAPHSIPQDLLLIQELIGDSLQESHAAQDDDIRSSSDSDSDADDIASEDEIERELMTKTVDDTENSDEVPSSSSSSSDESDSEDKESELRTRLNVETVTEDFDDDDEGVAAQSNHLLHTKNEVVDIPVRIPDIQEVGPDEALEKVGEIMSIVGNVVIVMGLPSAMVNRASDRALDSDTLLVFEDRKVFGHIYETFGPTTQPLYQVRFNEAFPLDPEKVRVSRQVFHVPQRSHYVFLHAINRLKGSDASNVHDEEPAEDELEFSDDEAEAAHRQLMKRRRSTSRASSQQPSTRHPSETSTYDGTAFDAYSPYDSDYGTAPSRPPPMPYVDPYSEEYNVVSSEMATTEATKDANHGETSVTYHEARRGKGASRQHLSQPRSRGKGRGRGGRSNHRGMAKSPQPTFPNSESVEPYSPHDPRPITAGAVSHGDTGPSTSSMPYAPTWQGFPQAQSFNFGAHSYQSQAAVQPHINPRFASAFGFNLYSSPYTQFTQQPPSPQFDQGAWTNDWARHMATSDQNNDPNNNAS